MDSTYNKMAAMRCEINALKRQAATVSIAIHRRADDYHACLTRDAKRWGCGQTTAEAIGNLVLSFPDVFRIEIKE